jgi:hypothetical protein
LAESEPLNPLLEPVLNSYWAFVGFIELTGRQVGLKFRELTITGVELDEEGVVFDMPLSDIVEIEGKFPPAGQGVMSFKY